MRPLPTGTLTFLFTDIQGSTRLWEEHPESMRLALARHDALIRQAIEAQEGTVFKTVGDAFCAVFPTAPHALNAALTAQGALFSELWPEALELKVRMALHTGVAEAREGDYFGPTLNRVARLLAVAHGGQTLLSDVTAGLCTDTLPSEVSLRSLGSHTLRDLSRRETLYQLQHPALPIDFPPLKSVDQLPTNLPEQLTSFIGREKEMAEAKVLFAKTRLLTFAGSGGSGKTRLALQLAAEMLEEYADGVWLAELAALSEPDLLASTLAKILGIAELPGKPAQQNLLESLRDRSLLLLLDNCEHLLTACAHLTAALLRSCPHVKVLATSREALGINGEQTYRVPSLSLPGLNQTKAVDLSASEAVQLFLDRATYHRPDFMLTESNAPVLAQLCHRLDGIPLAIELGAARIRSLSVEEITKRLDQRFRLLTGGDRTALPRQQTLRALIDWSYDLLTEPEKLLLRRVSVFLGGWTLEAAETVGAGDGPTGTVLEDWEVLDVLTGLTDKSLVLAQEENGQERYRLLETVRQYGRDRLLESGESEAIHSRHRDYFLTFATEADSKLRGADQITWLNRLEAEHENLRNALEWSLGEEDGTLVSLRLCGTVQRFWWTRGYVAEGRGWSDRALERPATMEDRWERAKVLTGAGNLAFYQSDYSAAETLYTRSLEIRREITDPGGTAASLSNLGLVAHVRGDYPSARTYQEESLTIRREIGDRHGIASSLINLGNAANMLGDYPAAQAAYEESRALRQEMGDRHGLASVLNNLGDLAFSHSDFRVARDCFAECLQFLREIGDRPAIANALSNYGNVAYILGDHTTARAAYEESLTIQREIGNRQGIANALNNLGLMAQPEGDYRTAKTYFEEALAMQQEIGDRPGAAGTLTNLGSVARAMGDVHTAETYLEESLAIKRELGNRPGSATSLMQLGLLAYDRGDYLRARAVFEESLTIWRGLGDRLGITRWLETFADHALRENAVQRAVLLWSAAENLRREMAALRPASEQQEYEHKLAELRRSLGDEAFRVAWSEGSTLTMEQAIETALKTSLPEEAP